MGCDWGIDKVKMKNEFYDQLYLCQPWLDRLPILAAKKYEETCAEHAEWDSNFVLNVPW